LQKFFYKRLVDNNLKTDYGRIKILLNKTEIIKYLNTIIETNQISSEVIEEKKQEAKEQIERYKTSNLFKDITDIRYLMIIFIGKNKYEVTEL
jgi:Ser-tRNA(Ala) deacylase AlaX